MNRVVALSLMLAITCVAATASAVAVGDRAPDIGMDDLGGHRVTIAGLRGQVFVVDLFASWCAPCEHELPVLQRLYDTLHDQGFTVVAVSADHTRAALDRFLRRLHVTFPVVLDSAGVVPRRYDSHTQPTSYIVDRHGIVRHVHRSYRARDAAPLEREIRALLAEARP